MFVFTAIVYSKYGIIMFRLLSYIQYGKKISFEEFLPRNTGLHYVDQFIYCLVEKIGSFINLVVAFVLQPLSNCKNYNILLIQQ